MADTTDRLVAAVDCGSNSTRLLVARVEQGGGVVRPVARTGEITRLAEGVDASSQLSASAIERVLAVLSAYRVRWCTMGVERVAISATSAVRDARNAATFVSAVADVTGAVPVVLTGAQEAALTYEGAVTGEPGSHHVVCDIGGGSTELVVGDSAPRQWTSLQLGSVRLRERHLHHDPPTEVEYAALLMDVDQALARQPEAFAAQKDAPLIAVAGTALTSAAVARRASDFAHADGAILGLGELIDVVEELAWVPAVRRLHHPAIRSGREDVIVAGTMVLARVAHRFGFDRIRVRAADLLDAAARRVAVGAWPPPAPDVAS